MLMYRTEYNNSKYVYMTCVARLLKDFNGHKTRQTFPVFERALFYSLNVGHMFYSKKRFGRAQGTRNEWAQRRAPTVTTLCLAPMDFHRDFNLTDFIS